MVASTDRHGTGRVAGKAQGGAQLGSMVLGRWVYCLVRELRKWYSRHTQYAAKYSNELQPRLLNQLHALQYGNSQKA